MTYLKVGDWQVHANGSQGTLRIRRETSAALHVYRLDGVGHRAAEVGAKVDGGSLVVPLDGSHLTLWYEVAADAN